MEFVQPPVTTLHNLTDHVPAVSPDQAAVVLPMTEREYASLATERLLLTLERSPPGRVLVPLRAGPEMVSAFASWLHRFDLPLDVLWCSGESLGSFLADYGVVATGGKGRDIWLALGIAASDHQFVICHDADTRSYEEEDLNRLLAPLEWGYSLSKAYYARVSEDGMYGRLFRLFYEPLIRALNANQAVPVIEFLGAFRYALAGEFGLRADLARRVRAEPRYGLEVGVLGDAFAYGGLDGSAQVDLGRYEHDHRAVWGPTGLVDMSQDVGAAVFRVVEEHGGEPAYQSLSTRYQAIAERTVRQYAADAKFNGLPYDSEAELAQIAAYAEAVHPPASDSRLPAWNSVSFTPQEVYGYAAADLETVQ